MLFNAAGYNAAEMRHIGVNIQGKTVAGHALAAHLNANGGDLARPGSGCHPDAGITFVTPALNTKIGLDQND